MRRLIVGACVALVMGMTPVASAQHPSEIRNEQGFGGGPHCHINNNSGNPAYPSHTAHVANLSAGGDVFTADPDCDGEAG